MTATTTNAHDVLTAFGAAPVAEPKRPRCRVKDDAHSWILGEIGRRVAAHIERGVSIDQVADIAKVLEVETSTLFPDGTNHLRSEVAASVTAAMVEHGQTPEQLAEAIGMSAPALWRRLQGLAAFTAEDVVRIARALDVEVGVLLG